MMRKWCSLLLLLVGVLAWGQQLDLSLLAPEKTPFRNGDRVVFLGDSITQYGDYPGGYLQLLRNAFAQAGLATTLVNAGIAGDTVPNLQGRLERDVLAKAPTIVFIYIGINDVWLHNGDQGAPKERFTAGLRAIISTLQQRGIIVVLATPSVIGEKTPGENQFDPALDAFAAVSRSLAQEYHIELCDLRTIFTEYEKAHNGGNRDSGILTADTVHLNATGNTLVAQEALKSLTTALQHAPIMPVLQGEEFLDQAMVTIDLRGGTVDEQRGVTMHYTLDGTAPTAVSPSYSKPFAVQETTTVTVQAFRGPTPLNALASATYTKWTDVKPALKITDKLVAGLNYDYYGGGWTKLPDYAVLKPAASGVVAQIDTTPKLRYDYFSMRFTGYLDIPATGIYTFSTVSDDGSSLLIDGVLVVNNDGAHPPQLVEGRIALEKGTHAIEVRYFQGGGGGTLDVQYALPNSPRQPIPATLLWHIVPKEG